jgi:membrane-bound metal-dependent hydrolase YbcI (DUF457 family)
MLVVVTIDVSTGPFQTPRLVAGVYDEWAHVVTALLLLTLLPSQVVWPAILGAVCGATLIDIDHVPGELGWAFLTMGTNRPYSHSLLSIAGLALIAHLGGERWYRLTVGVAIGMATHLLRDAATGGVPLLWPVSSATVVLSYAVYATMLFAASGVLLWRLRTMAASRSFVRVRSRSTA